MYEEKATIPFLAQRLTSELVEHINGSLPTLEDQIKTKLQITKEELERCGRGVPEDESERLSFLVEIIQQFNLDIAHVTQGEESVSLTKTPKLFTRVRSCFNIWQEELDESIIRFNSSLKSEIEEFEKFHRGRELPGFINYKTFEAIVKEKIENMEDPARSILKTVTDIVGKTFSEIARKHFYNFNNFYKVSKSKIENLKQSQEDLADNLIKIQFLMERMVYSQDKCYRFELETIFKNNTPPQTSDLPVALQRQVVDLLQCSTKEMAHHVEAYFKGAADRLANQIPLIIQFYLLQEYGKQLQKEMLQLLQQREDHKTLLEESKNLTSTRNFLKQRIHRLSEAQKCLLSFRG